MTTTFNVTVNAGKFLIDGEIAPLLNLTKGQTYKFSYNFTGFGHALRVSTTPDGPHNGGTIYNYGGSTTPYDITYTFPLNAPTTLYYYCTNHSGMGGQINLLDPPAAASGDPFIAPMLKE